MAKKETPLQTACLDFAADMKREMYRQNISHKELAKRVGVGERQPPLWLGDPERLAGLPLERLYRIKRVLNLNGTYL